MFPDGQSTEIVPEAKSRPYERPVGIGPPWLRRCVPVCCFVFFGVVAPEYCPEACGIPSKVVVLAHCLLTACPLLARCWPAACLLLACVLPARCLPTTFSGLLARCCGHYVSATSALSSLLLPPLYCLIHMWPKQRAIAGRSQSRSRRVGVVCPRAPQNDATAV